MRIKVDTPLKNLDGQIIKKGFEKDGKVETTEFAFRLRDICVNSLLANDNNLRDGMEKMKRFLLAEKIQKANELDLKVEDIALIKELIGKNYSPLFVGSAYRLLDK